MNRSAVQVLGTSAGAHLFQSQARLGRARRRLTVAPGLPESCYKFPMSLVSSIDTALAKAEAENCRPFRIHLADAEIAILRSDGILDEPVGGHRAAGAYKGVNVFESSQSELMAQPEDRFPALYIAIAAYG